MYSDGGFTTTSFTHTNKNYINDKATVILNCVPLQLMILTQVYTRAIKKKYPWETYINKET
jgi:hypothetical protein